MTQKDSRLNAPVLRVLLASLVLAGCSAMPTTGGLVDVLAPDGATYHTLGLTAIAGVSVSSTRNSYFQAGHLIDGKLNTAWAPAWSDAAPAITLSLPAATALSGLSIKLSLGQYSSPANARVKVSVAASVDGGATFTPVATGLTPAETTLQTFALPAAVATQVRLTFQATGLPVQQLLVCDVRLSGTAAPTPAPSIAPTPVPSVPVTPPTPPVEVSVPPIVLPSPPIVLPSPPVWPTPPIEVSLPPIFIPSPPVLPSPPVGLPTPPVFIPSPPVLPSPPVTIPTPPVVVPTPHTPPTPHGGRP